MNDEQDTKKMSWCKSVRENVLSFLNWVAMVTGGGGVGSEIWQK